MRNEFNLSKKIKDDPLESNYEMVWASDIKEFIRLLKEETTNQVKKGRDLFTLLYFHQLIDKFAGKELI